VAVAADMGFDPYLFILQRLYDHGYSAYFVGGCVRDFFLNKEIGDVDIATSAPQKHVEQLFGDMDIDCNASYFGVTTLNKPVICQIATFRTEKSYHKHRYPKEVSFVDDVSVDAQRRDFTINALYLDKDKNLYDPFKGKEDLENRLIRCIGDPFIRLNEDALRILRAVRFSVTLEFTMEKELLQSAIALADTLVFLKEDTIELERKKLRLHPLNKNQIELLNFYRSNIPSLYNYL
jgi:tRNA nucleotidyltransferase (CCA-adding enzyme)